MLHVLQNKTNIEIIVRPVETGGRGGDWGRLRPPPPPPPPRFLLASIFDELKKNSVKVKNSAKLQN